MPAQSARVPERVLPLKSCPVADSERESIAPSRTVRSSSAAGGREDATASQSMSSGSVAAASSARVAAS